MAGTGWSNPFPLSMGGGVTDTDNVYRFLRSAVGKGGASTDDESLEASWRAAKARAIAASKSFMERAALQAFPDKATDALPYYERLLNSFLGDEAPDDERRAAVAAAWTLNIEIASGELEAGLQRIDERFEIVAIDLAETTTTVFGRKFQDLAASEPFNWPGRKSTLLPNYSTAYVVTAKLDLGASTPMPTETDKRTIARAKAYLAEVLPAWVGAQVVTGVGFQLDLSPLDLTALSP